MKRFLLLCAALALVLICAEAWPARADQSFDFNADLETDEDGGGRTARRNFFDHRYEAWPDREHRRWRETSRPGVERTRQGVRFSYRDRDYDAVWLLTDASGWDQQAMDYDPDAGVWEITIPVEPGTLRYQFRVRREDGSTRDRTDPTNPTRRRDVDRGWVSRVEIGSGGEVQLDEGRRREEQRLDRYDLSLFSGIGADYQRVDGFFLKASPFFESRDPWAPAIHSTIGYGFSSKRGSASGSFIQPLSAGGRWRAVFSGYDYSDYTDRTAVGDTENFLSTLVFREDNRDWHRREGLSLGVEMEKVRELLLRVEFRSDTYRSMPKKVVAGWGGREDFLPNPAIDDGLMRSVLVRARWGDDFTHIWAQYENGSAGAFSSDFDFSQLILQGRLRWRVGWAQTLHVRARWGTELGGDLPVQKQFVAGGIGTVRGYAYQSLYAPADEGGSYVYGGDQLGLFNAEYVLGLHEDIGVGLFFDSGMVHEKAGGLRLGDFRNSIGLGFILSEPGDSALRLDFIQPLSSDGDHMVQGRLTRPF